MATSHTDTSRAPHHQTRPPSPSSFSRPASSTAATPPWAGGSPSAGNSFIKRSYSEIIAAAKSTTSSTLIQFKISKVLTDGVKPPNLQDSDFGEFLFDFLKIDAKCCLGIDVATGRYDTKELLVKSDTDLTNITTSPSKPHLFKQHHIHATALTSQVTKVTFKNVPLYVPDEEILHLCCHYGELTDGVVHKDSITLGVAAKHSLPSSTRWVTVRLHPGKTFRNFYWLAGPLSGDVGRRITVLHSNQPRQCSHCFKYSPSSASSPITKADCPGGGDGKTCKSSGTPRAKMSNYIELLRTEGYVSLRDQYFSVQAAFPSLRGDGKKQDDVLANIDAADHDLDALEDPDHLQGKVGETKQKEEQPLPSFSAPVVPIESKLPKFDTKRSQRPGKAEKALKKYISQGNPPLKATDLKHFAVDSLVSGDIMLNAGGKAEISPEKGEIFWKGFEDSVDGTSQSRVRMDEVKKKVLEQLNDPLVQAEFKHKLEASPEGKKRGGRTFSESVGEVEDTGQSKSQRIVSPVKT